MANTVNIWSPEMVAFGHTLENKQRRWQIETIIALCAPHQAKLMHFSTYIFKVVSIKEDIVFGCYCRFYLVNCGGLNMGAIKRYFRILKIFFLYFHWNVMFCVFLGITHRTLDLSILDNFFSSNIFFVFYTYFLIKKWNKIGV